MAITADTNFYNPSASLSTLFTSPTITPLNSLLYNAQSSNLASHGLHPYYQHLLASLPLLLGPSLCLLPTVTLTCPPQRRLWAYPPLRDSPSRGPLPASCSAVHPLFHPSPTIEDYHTILARLLGDLQYRPWPLNGSLPSRRCSTGSAMAWRAKRPCGNHSGSLLVEDIQPACLAARPFSNEHYGSDGHACRGDAIESHGGARHAP